MGRREGYGRKAIAGWPAYAAAAGLALICWGAGYGAGIGFPVCPDAYDVPLWRAFCAWVPSRTAAYGIGLLLLFGTAFLVQRMNVVLGLIREKTALPFLFYVLLISTDPVFFPLKPALAASLCLIFGVYELFLSYHNPVTQREAFNWAFLIGVASLWWIPVVWFVPLFWFGMYRMRAWNARTFGASLVGFLTVYWFVLGASVWTRDFSWFTGSFPLLARFDFWQMPGSVWHWITLAYSALVVLAAVIHIFTQEYSDSLRTRENLSFLVVFYLWSFLLYFLYEDASEEFLMISCLPASILMAHFFAVKGNKWFRWLFYFTVAGFVTVFWIALWNS